MDPWGNAAAQYNQGLGQLQQINQQGYQAQAQGPASIYDRFLQGYVQAKQMKMQEEAAARDQQNRDRQTLLAEETLRHNRTVETQKLKDEQDRQLRDARSKAVSMFNNYNDRVPGARQLLESTLKDAGLNDIPLPSVERHEGGETLAGPVQPGQAPLVRQPWENELSGYGPDALEAKQQQDLKRQKELREEWYQGETLSNQITREDRRDARQIEAEDRRDARQTKALAAVASRAGASGLDMNDPEVAAAVKALGERAKDSGDLTGLGMGANPLKLAALKSMGKGILESGKPVSLAAAKADFKANTKSLTDLQAMADNINAFEKTAIGNWSRFEKAITDLENTGSPAFNRPINWLRSNAAGDPKVAAAIASGQAAHTEFARLINNPRLVGVLTDNAREEVFRSLPKNFEDATPAQIKKVGEILRADAAQRKNDLNSQIVEIKGRISGKSPDAQTLIEKAKGGGERKQFKNNSSGSMEWFKRDENGKWVKE